MRSTRVATLAGVAAICTALSCSHDKGLDSRSATPTWEITIGGAADDVPISVLPTGDHEFVIVGNTNSYGAGGNDIYIVKVDAAGNKV